MTAVDLVDRTNPRGRFLGMVKDQLAPKATEQELVWFGAISQRLQVSPFTNPPEIYLIPRYDKRLRREVHRPQLSIDGRIAIALRSDRLVGIEGPEFRAARLEDGTAPPWVDLWDTDDYPYAARYLVHVRGFVTPVNGTCRWQEFVQTDDNGNVAKMWAEKPSLMLAKVALALALRRAGVAEIPSDLAVELDDGPTSEVDQITGPAPATVDPETGELTSPGSEPARRVLPPAADRPECVTAARAKLALVDAYEAAGYDPLVARARAAQTWGPRQSDEISQQHLEALLASVTDSPVVDTLERTDATGEHLSPEVVAGEAPASGENTDGTRFTE
jgi:hypothetical protein